MSAPARLEPAGARITTDRRRRFLSDVVIDYGPPDVLARLFLRADTELREKGVEVSLTTLDELKEVNEENRDTWRPLLPMFDPAVTPVSRENSFAVVVRDGRGKAVAAQGGLLYDLTRTTLKEEFESMRFFYSDPARMVWPGESCVVTAPAATRITGRAAFVGGMWYHPDWRKKNLVGPLGRINRAYAFTRWYADYAFSVMVEKLVEKNFARVAAWPHVEWDVRMTNLPTFRGESSRLALIWTNVEEQLAHFRDYASVPLPAGADAQVDAVVHQGSR